MLGFRATRQGGDHFHEMAEYLRARGPGGDATLCGVIELNNSLLRGAYPNARRGLPWPTLVIGSGCSSDVVDASSGPAPNEMAVEKVVRSVLGEDSADEDQKALKTQLVSFTVNLVREREHDVSIEENDLFDTGSCDEEDEITALYGVAAMLSAETYHRRAIEEPRCLASPRIDAPERTEPERTEVALDTQLGFEKLRAALRALVDEHSQALDPHLDDAERGVADLALASQLAESYWHRLRRRSTGYPGWTDVMLELSHDQGIPRLVRGVPQPNIVSVTGAARRLIARFEAPTAESWNRRDQDVMTEDHRFFDSVSDLLVMQARTRRQVTESALDDTTGSTPHVDQPPIASAFAAGFDLEVEMALLHRHPEQTFVIAVPVHLISGRAPRDVARTCWLGLIVPPESESGGGRNLDDLRKPSADRWFVLSNRSYYPIERIANVAPQLAHRVPSIKNLALGDLPVVVRLNGCPLIECPDLREGGILTPLGEKVLDAVLEDDTTRSSINRMYHAVLLLEYDALQQTAMEMFEIHDRDVELRRRPGLPREITAVARHNLYFDRFWIVVGVPVREGHLRFRVASHLAPPQINPFPELSVEHPGVVVNIGVHNENDGELYHWLGFDVVRDYHTALTPHLSSLAKHKYPADRRDNFDDLCPGCEST